MCSVRFSPDWNHVVLGCESEVDGDHPAGHYLAEAWTDMTTWQKIENKSSSMLNPVGFYPYDIAWAPDSSVFTFCDYNQGVATLLVDVDHPDSPVEIDAWGCNVYWSPDSLYFLANRTKYLEHTKLMLFNRDGEELPLPEQEDIFVIDKEPLKVSLQWMPDSHHLLYFLDRTSAQCCVSDLIDHDISTGERHFLLGGVDTAGFFTGISPDGRNLIFQSWNDIIETQKTGELIKSGDSRWFLRGWHLDMETGELNRLTHADHYRWTSDSRHLYNYQLLENRRAQLLVANEKGTIESLYDLPRAFDELQETHFELIDNYLYYHHRVFAPEKQEPLIRYDLKTENIVALIAPRAGWQMRIVGRKGDRWLVRFWKEGEHRETLEQEYVLYQVDE